MLEDMMLVKVTNISNGPVVYTIPELNVRREFAKGQPREITIAELRALSYQSGGLVLLREFLSVDNDEFLAEIGIKPEPEYKWTEQDVIHLLENESVARLQDALEFAPDGIVELIKEVAVSRKLSDMNKRQAIFEATGFNVTRAIDVNMESIEDTELPAPKTRRVKEEAPTIKTNYKVTS